MASGFSGTPRHEVGLVEACQVDLARVRIRLKGRPLGSAESAFAPLQCDSRAVIITLSVSSLSPLALSFRLLSETSLLLFCPYLRSLNTTYPLHSFPSGVSWLAAPLPQLTLFSKFYCLRLIDDNVNCRAILHSFVNPVAFNRHHFGPALS